jgi:DnaA N-terminal domain
MQTFKLLQHDSILLSQPQLIKHFGRAGAQLLSQLHYWITKKDSLGCHHQGNHWIYNTAEEWAEQLQLSVRHVRRLVAEFVDLGILRVEKLHKLKSVRTNYYSIDYDQLNHCVRDLKIDGPGITILGYDDKMSPSTCQNGTLYIQKLPNKDINKSEGLEPNSQVVGQGDQILKKVSQVKQVRNLTLENQKVLEAKLPIPTGAIIIARELARSTTLTTSLVKTSTAQDMLKAWNHHFADQDASKPKVRLSKDTAPMLVAAFKTKFESNLAHWQSYCEQIKSSPYLMGDSFKLTLSWALKFGTIDRIRAGDLGVKIAQNQTIPSGDCLKKQDEGVDQAIEALPENSSLKAIRRQIAKAIGAGHYLSWFHPAEFCEAGGKLWMKAPNAFIQDWWETHYDQILKLVASELEPVAPAILSTDKPKGSLLNDKHSQIGQGSNGASAEDTPLLPPQNDPTHKKMEALPESQAVKGLRHKIAQAIGDAEYNAWFHAAEFCENDGDIRLVAPNRFIERYWEAHFPWINRSDDRTS